MHVSVRLELFQVPYFRDDWNRRMKAGSNSSASSLRSWGLILSGPGDLGKSRFLSRLATLFIMGIVSRRGLDLVVGESPIQL